MKGTIVIFPKDEKPKSISIDGGKTHILNELDTVLKENKDVQFESIQVIIKQ